MMDPADTLHAPWSQVSGLDQYKQRSRALEESEVRMPQAVAKATQHNASLTSTVLPPAAVVAFYADASTGFSFSDTASKLSAR